MTKTIKSAKYVFFALTYLLFLISCHYDDDVKQPEKILDCGFEASDDDISKLLNLSYSISDYSRNSTITQVPVSLNIVRLDDGSGNVTQSDIDFQFDYLNEIYADAGIEFVICDSVNYVNNSELYIADSYDQYQLRQLYNKDDIVNVYVTGDVVNNGSSVCGYAYYPGGLEVVFISSSCFNNGSTLPHEMGHFFGLLHTHGSNTPNSTQELADGSNGDSTGDMIADTPSDPKLSNLVDYNCNYTGDFLDNNGQPHNPDPSNIMSYSRKECRNFFSAGQLDLINYTLVTYRSNLTCNYLEPDGSEENPFIIDSEITSNLNLNNGDCETNNEIIYYATTGDLQLNDFRIRLKGQVKLTVNGNVNGSDIAKIVSRDCAEVCVSGLVNVMSRQFRDGTINADCGIPIGSINNPKVVNQIFTKTRNIKNGNCNTDSLKHFIRYGDIELGDFDLRVIGKSVLTITGDVNGNGTLIAKKCGSITVNGSINVETLEQSGGVID